MLEQSIVLCKSALENLREYVKDYSFNNQSEEIEFYKHIKPKVLSYLIFYAEQLNIETKRTREGKKEQIKYFKKAISRFQDYFKNNLELYHYYKSKATHLDEQYFIRNNKTIRLNIEIYHYFFDNKFSTNYDTTVATIRAYIKLIEYLKNEISKLNNEEQNMKTISPFQKETQLNWTGSKTDLVELIYALHNVGAINSGTAEIKDIAVSCEQMFNIDLGDYYHSFVEMRNRKINPTKFLDKLKDKLVQYMNSLDK